MVRKPILLGISVLALAALACGLSARSQNPAAAPAAADPADGEKLFQSLGCSGCHAGGSDLAPSLAGVVGEEVPLESGETVTADEAYLRESILDPGAQVVRGYDPIMPEYEDQLGAEQVDALIEYIRSLEE